MRLSVAYSVVGLVKIRSVRSRMTRQLPDRVYRITRDGQAEEYTGK
ncbi:hypothetical protein [Streptomyces sp. NPDC058739]